jgi:heme/copper-type cytochrome/quinol oxidase subunit 2
MSLVAILMMVGVMFAVTATLVYFIVKVFRTPPKPEPDSYIYNDDEPR